MLYLSFFSLVISTNITAKWTKPPPLYMLIPGMGTEIQANAIFPKNHRVIDLNGNGRNGVRSFYHNNQTRRNRQDPDPLMAHVYQNGYSVYDIEKMKQTILKHELIFRNQLQELHSLYRRQRDLMNVIKMGEMKKAPSLMLARFGDALGNSFTNSHIEPKDFFRNSHDMDRGLSLCNFGLRSGRTGNEHAEKRRMDELSGTRDFSSAKSPITSLAEPRNELLSSPLDIGESLFRKKSKIFGVEIYEGNNDSSNAFSNTPTSVRGNDSSNSVSFCAKECTNLKQKITSHLENPKRELPWFLRNTQLNSEPSKGIKDSYFMNADSLRNCSQSFSAQFLKETREIPAQLDMLNAIDNKSESAKKILGCPISDTLHNFNVNSSPINGGSAVDSKTDDLKDQLETKNIDYTSNLRLHIDLNLFLCEEDAPSAPSLPETIVKTATTEIDLEAPAVIEYESIKPEVSKEKSEISLEECDKHAADALICIFAEKRLIDESDELLGVEYIDRLKWFADIISSQCGEEDSIPEGLDDFELTALKLEDMKDKRHLYSPMVLNVERDREETHRAGTICEGSRRVRSRRGRKQKDLQKDVVPNLVTLSHHEMKEDMKAFEEIRKGAGQNRHLSKKGKGRKRFVISRELEKRT